MKKYISNSPVQTKNLAKKIAKSIKGGKVLALVGELGSGKTQFTKGLAEYYSAKGGSASGGKINITSPTFVLLKPYKIENKKISRLVHVDCYRLDNAEELLAIGLDEFIENKNNLVVIEWAEKIKELLSQDTIWIDFKLGKTEQQRIIQIN